MLAIKLSVNSRLVEVKFLRNQSCTWIFGGGGMVRPSNPHIVQESTVFPQKSCWFLCQGHHCSILDSYWDPDSSGVIPCLSTEDTIASYFSLVWEYLCRKSVFLASGNCIPKCSLGWKGVVVTRIPSASPNHGALFPRILQTGKLGPRWVTSLLPREPVGHGQNLDKNQASGIPVQGSVQ